MTSVRDLCEEMISIKRKRQELENVNQDLFSRTTGELTNERKRTEILENEVENRKNEAFKQKFEKEQVEKSELAHRETKQILKDKLMETKNDLAMKTNEADNFLEEANQWKEIADGARAQIENLKIENQQLKDTNRQLELKAVLQEEIIELEEHKKNITNLFKKGQILSTQCKI